MKKNWETEILEHVQALVHETGKRAFSIDAFCNRWEQTIAALRHNRRDVRGRILAALQRLASAGVLTRLGKGFYRLERPDHTSDFETAKSTAYPTLEEQEEAVEGTQVDMGSQLATIERVIEERGADATEVGRLALTVGRLWKDHLGLFRRVLFLERTLMDAWDSPGPDRRKRGDR